MNRPRAALVFVSLLATATAFAQAGSAPAPRPGASRCDVRPAYPLQAARRGVQGTTIVEMTFGPDGAVATSRVVQASGPLPENALLDQAALAAMSQCRVAAGDRSSPSQRIEYHWKLDAGDTWDADAFRQAELDRLKQQATDDAKLPLDAERGVVAAQLALAKQYANAERRERDDKLASKWFRRAAEAGDADAQVYYGQRLMVGKGVSQDDDAGIAWLRKAAAQGSGTAAYGLGIFARAGRGMPASDSEAFRWFLQGAQAGSRAAMVEAADAYAKGAGAPRDDAQAARWYLAASAYNMYSVYRLGLAYRDGLGVPVDYERAAFCMALAGKHGAQGPGEALATIASHLDGATRQRVEARAEAWQVGEPLFK